MISSHTCLLKLCENVLPVTIMNNNFNDVYKVVVEENVNS